MRSVLLVIMSIMLVFSFSLLDLQAEEMTKEIGPSVERGGYGPPIKGRSLGAGIILGSPIGPNVKYWFNPHMAIDVGLGFENDFALYSDILWHDWTLFPQPPKGVLAGYLGLGLRYEEKKKDDEVGFRAVTGVAYWIASHPLEVFFEVAPVFQVAPDTDTELDAGIGFRYYFTGL